MEQCRVVLPLRTRGGAGGGKTSDGGDTTAVWKTLLVGSASTLLLPESKENVRHEMYSSPAGTEEYYWGGSLIQRLDLPI